jgi:hypothetical protein
VDATKDQRIMSGRQEQAAVVSSRSDDMTRCFEEKHSTYMFDVMFTAKGEQALVNISDHRRVLYRDDSFGRHVQPVSQLMAGGGRIWPLIGHVRTVSVLGQGMRSA